MISFNYIYPKSPYTVWFASIIKPKSPYTEAAAAGYATITELSELTAHNMTMENGSANGGAAAGYNSESGVVGGKGIIGELPESYNR